MKNIHKISLCAALCSLGQVSHAQTIIDPLTGSLTSYTTTLVNDTSSGGGDSVSFTDSASGLSANYVGSTAHAEQAFFLADASSFGTVFSVGDTLSVNVSMAASSIQEDFGLAIASTATPTPSSSSLYDTRTTFDWASVSVRPSQTAVRGGEDISGGATSTGFVSTAAANTVSQLFIQWVSADVFNLGYVDTSAVSHTLFTATFAGTSTIGTAIGFYGDMRDSGGTTLGDFTNLAITPAPEPCTLAVCGMGFTGLIMAIRRKK